MRKSCHLYDVLKEFIISITSYLTFSRQVVDYFSMLNTLNRLEISDVNNNIHP